MADIEMLSSEGIMRVTDLALFLNIDESTLIQKLTDNGIKILRLSAMHKAWLVRLEDLKAVRS